MPLLPGAESAAPSVAAVAPAGDGGVELLQPSIFSLVAADAELSGALNRHFGSEPKGFNIITENAADLADLIWNYCGAQLADRMAWTNPENFTGLCAESIIVSDDYKTYTIRLREGIKWHKPGGIDLNDPKYGWMAGDHFLTSRDVLFSLQTILHPQVDNGFVKNYYEDVDLEHCELLDERTIAIRWKKKTYQSLSSTVGLTVIPEWFYSRDEYGNEFPEESFGLNFNQHWYNNKGLVGAGPYRMVEYSPGEFIKLERNEDYFGDLPAIRQIVYPIYSDPDLELLKLKAGEHTFGGLAPRQYREQIQKWADVPAERRPKDNPFLNGQISHETMIVMVFYYIGWNADKPMFQDKRVRQAMTMACNRQAIIDNVFVGLGEVAVGPFFALSPYHDPAIEPWPFDLQKAKQLLNDAGWEDSNNDGLLDKDLTPNDGDPRRTPFEFKILIYGTSPEWSATANIFKEDLLKIGVKMDIDAAEWSLMQKKMDEKEFDAFTGGWGLSWDEDPFQIWHSSQADIPRGSNRVGFRNAEADKIIETLRETFDPAQRTELLRQFHRILHEEQPYTFFRTPKAVYCWRQELHNVIFSKVRPHSNSLPWWVAERQ